MLCCLVDSSERSFACFICLLLWHKFKQVIPIIMLRRKRVGLGLCCFVIMATAILVGVQTKANGYQPTPIYSDFNVNRTFDAGNEVYFKPFAHAGSFCVGIITGKCTWVANKACHLNRGAYDNPP